MVNQVDERSPLLEDGHGEGLEVLASILHWRAEISLVCDHTDRPL